MTRLRIILFIWITFCQILSAQKQKNFYFEPVLAYKIAHPGVNFSTPQLDTKYFKIETSRIIYPSSLLNLIPGINLGYTLKNNDRLNIAMLDDHSGVKFNFNALSEITGSPSKNSILRSSYSYAVRYKNLSLIYKRCIFIRQSKVHPGNFVRGFLNFGLSYGFNRYKTNEVVDNIAFYRTSADSTQITLVGYTGTGKIARNVAFKGSLGVDLTFGKNNIEWFSVNAGYIFARASAYSGTAVDITVSNKNINEKYLYHVNGSGNSFYLTFSRRIHPFVHRKRDKAIKDAMEKNNFVP